MTPPPLKRLFDRIDAAAATDPALATALDYWRMKRAGRIVPAPADLDLQELAAVSPHLFVFQRKPAPEDDWDLLFAGVEAETMLKGRRSAKALSRLKLRRLAVRLRRLFRLTEETAEPVSAEFELRDAAGRRWFCEALAAPLGTTREAVDSIFGALVRRPAAEGKHAKA